MIRLVFASCLLLILSSCSGIAGLALSAASSAKSTYDGYKYIEKKVKEEKTKKRAMARQGWFQIHDEGIWYGSYIMLDRRNYRIYGNPRDKEKYLDDNAIP
jgi:hypothetical protein